ELVGGNHVVDQRFDECRFFEIEEGIARARRSGRRRRGGLLSLSLLRRDGDGGGCCGSAAQPRALQEIAAAQTLVAHQRLPEVPARSEAPERIILVRRVRRSVLASKALATYPPHS